MIIASKHLLVKLINIFKWPWLRLNPLLLGVVALVAVCATWRLWRGGEPPLGVPRALRPLLRFPEGYSLRPAALNARQLDDLAALVGRLNHDAEVYNWDHRYPLRPNTDIFLVQVHRDVERLQYLIIALGQVTDIAKTLVIFSHSYYDNQINRLIRSIKFVKVMQIYYPYSVQLNPDKFPGIDSDDCNDTVMCAGRSARRAEHKHHWWWKAHYVFTKFDWSEKHRGMVIFLDESDYVLPDILYMLKYARQALDYFSTAQVISFGRLWAQGLNYDLLTVDTWRPPYDRGLTFNRTTWLKIIALAPYFCFYDDASWSYSLVNLFERFPRGFAEMVAAAAPRVLSTSTFGSGRAAAAWSAGEGRRGWRLYPRTVRAVVLFGTAGRKRHEWRRPPRGNGGWADLRDHMLCLDPLLATTTEPVTDTTFMFEEFLASNGSKSRMQ